MSVISSILMLAIPVVIITFFIISLCLFISAKRKNKREPGSIGQEVMRNRKVMLIISSVIAVIFTAIVIGFVVLLSMAITSM